MSEPTAETLHNPWDANCSRHLLGEPTKPDAICSTCRSAAASPVPGDRVEPTNGSDEDDPAPPDLWIDPERIKEQRAKGWLDFHPEVFCHRCGTRNVTCWFTDNETWNAVEESTAPILCPQCFTEAAANVWPNTIWHLRRETEDRPSWKERLLIADWVANSDPDMASRIRRGEHVPSDPTEGGHRAPDVADVVVAIRGHLERVALAVPDPLLPGLQAARKALANMKSVPPRGITVYTAALDAVDRLIREHSGAVDSAT